MSDIRVMLIDDDIEFLEETREMFEEAGYEMRTSSTVDGAQETIADFSPDVLLLDMKMNGNGKKLTSTLRENESTRKLPVVIVSAYMDEESEKRLRGELEVDDILEKPVNPLDLIAAVERLTDGHR